MRDNGGCPWGQGRALMYPSSSSSCSKELGPSQTLCSCGSALGGWLRECCFLGSCQFVSLGTTPVLGLGEFIIYYYVFYVLDSVSSLSYTLNDHNVFFGLHILWSGQTGKECVGFSQRRWQLGMWMTPGSVPGDSPCLNWPLHPALGAPAELLGVVEVQLWPQGSSWIWGKAKALVPSAASQRGTWSCLSQTPRAGTVQVTDKASLDSSKRNKGRKSPSNSLPRLKKKQNWSGTSVFSVSAGKSAQLETPWNPLDGVGGI